MARGTRGCAGSRTGVLRPSGPQRLASLPVRGARRWRQYTGGARAQRILPLLYPHRRCAGGVSGRRNRHTLTWPGRNLSASPEARYTDVHTGPRSCSVRARIVAAVRRSLPRRPRPPAGEKSPVDCPPPAARSARRSSPRGDGAGQRPADAGDLLAGSRSPLKANAPSVGPLPAIRSPHLTGMLERANGSGERRPGSAGRCVTRCGRRDAQAPHSLRVTARVTGRRGKWGAPFCRTFARTGPAPGSDQGTGQNLGLRADRERRRGDTPGGHWPQWGRAATAGSESALLQRNPHVQKARGDGRRMSTGSAG